VIGWHYSQTTVEGLLPPTIINLVSFVLLLVAMIIGDWVVYAQDPTDMNFVLQSLAEGGTGMVEVDLHSPVIYRNRFSVQMDGAQMDGAQVDGAQMDGEKVVPVLRAA
jgi:hypothetical protein